MIICDEAAYMQELFFKKVVIPMMQMENCALICISSLGDSTNYYSRLVSKTDPDGNPAFNTIRYSLACARCEKTSEPWKCQHKLGEIPRWQSEERQKIAKLMLEDDGDIIHAELMCVVHYSPFFFRKRSIGDTGRDAGTDTDTLSFSSRRPKISSATGEFRAPRAMSYAMRRALLFG